MSSADTKLETVAAAIDVIESTYDFMLAYAAQGRASEDDDPMGIRPALKRADEALEFLNRATPAQFGVDPGPLAEATQGMIDVLRQDIAKTRAAFRFVLAQRSVGSQIIDNLNASIHVRALLTDIFLLDEALEKQDN